MERTKRNTKRVGDLSELEAIRALVRAGYYVAVPFGENQRYDLIVDKGGILSRVQVKTGRLRGGVILFACWSSHSHRNGPSFRTYAGQIEFFAVYCPDVDAVFMIPVSDVATNGSLRVAPAKNGQTSGIRWASTYLLSGKTAGLVGNRPDSEVRAAKIAPPPL